jgi:hypothetical protein
MTFPYKAPSTSDPVNHPAHYAEGRRYEVIDVIEDAVQFAPNPVAGGLQWQALKYIHRCWNKDSAPQDLRKARWYLDRLITLLEERDGSL